MTMRRDEFEASVWLLLRTFRVTVDNPRGFVDQLLALSLSFAAGDGPETTAARRAVLEQEGGGDALASGAAGRSPSNRGAGSLTGSNVPADSATNPQAVDIPDTPQAKVTI